ncbi:MAG: hypothetical protein QG608_908 [Actinomycetota bacterium]|nr:hypothetical protein [Actinomycetota bacterium]
MSHSTGSDGPAPVRSRGIVLPTLLSAALCGGSILALATAGTTALLQGSVPDGSAPAVHPPSGVVALEARPRPTTARTSSVRRPPEVVTSAIPATFPGPARSVRPDGPAGPSPTAEPEPERGDAGPVDDEPLPPGRTSLPEPQREVIEGLDLPSAPVPARREAVEPVPSISVTVPDPDITPPPVGPTPHSAHPSGVEKPPPGQDPLSGRNSLSGREPATRLLRLNEQRWRKTCFRACFLCCSGDRAKQCSRSCVPGTITP